MLTGCIGGPGITGAFAELACGVGYTETRPTLGAILVPMSRTTRAGRLGMQVLHASKTQSRLDVQSKGGEGAVHIQGNVDPGLIQPRYARTDFSVAEWQVGHPGFDAQVLLDGRVVLTEGWENVLERSGLESVEDGRNYVAVVLGPHLEIGGQGFWNRPAVALVAADPE